MRATTPVYSFNDEHPAFIGMYPKGCKIRNQTMVDA
jgi:hypothetical protein